MVESSVERSAFPYHEPDIVTIVILSTFLLALNIINYALDKVLYCGLLGQILLGTLWGTPGAQWLNEETEQVVVNVGYLGLILIVYEGGLSTSFQSLKANLFLSIGVALTGIGLPIAFSYVLQPLANATRLQAFAAGAALCSTSLGTTFTVLGTTGLISTRMGVVLSSAAMMDDVVGLVMVQVITNLGSSSSTSFNSISVIRPVFVSIAFAVIVPLTARFVVQPVTLWLNTKRTTISHQRFKDMLNSPGFALIIHTCILLGLVIGSSYAGTSNLFAAYLAGAAISWWDSEVSHTLSAKADAPVTVPSGESFANSGEAIFARFYQPGLQTILRPFFFASIGFSIPIARMFRGEIVWKGIVHTVLMTVGKLACGLWLMRLPPFLSSLSMPSRLVSKKSNTSNPIPMCRVFNKEMSTKQGSSSATSDIKQGDAARDKLSSHNPAPDGQPRRQNNDIQPISPPFEQPTASNISRKISKKGKGNPHIVPSGSKPMSSYPAAIIGCAMVARGEIGFLISSLAESNGVFAPQQQQTDAAATGTADDEDEIFLIVTWAVMLCTIIGPLCVGFLVRRMNRLQRSARINGVDRMDVLGVWG